MQPVWEARRADPREGSRILEPDRDEDDAGRGEGRIRCPRCAWEPERDSRWCCVCLHLWNTFETEGRCPSCGKRWETTQCHRCKAWSPHRAWYSEEDPSL